MNRFLSSINPSMVILIASGFLLVSLVVFSFLNYFHIRRRHRDFKKNDLDYLSGTCVLESIGTIYQEAVERRYYYYINYYCFELVREVLGAASIWFSLITMAMLWIDGMVWLQFLLSLVSFLCVVSVIFLVPEKRTQNFFNAWKIADNLVIHIKDEMGCICEGNPYSKKIKKPKRKAIRELLQYAEEELHKCRESIDGARRD